MDMTEAERILACAKQCNACKGNYDAAARYLRNNDIEGFKRVCRGNVAWLNGIRAKYVLTDGVAEKWHENGQLASRCTYQNDQLHGLHEKWHDNGQLTSRREYMNGRLHGLYETWRDNGQLMYRRAYEHDKCLTTPKQPATIHPMP